jgi:methyltransferase (TIGR00027 family)
VQDERRSTTAERAAALRALHQLVDAPLVLEDPVVLRLLPSTTVNWLRANPTALDDPSRRALRAFIAVRSRFADDTLREAVARGVDQYVLLGAGLDTFAYRTPFPAGRLRVFEVDHPATQAWKRERLQAAGIAQPADVEFVAANFESQSLAEIMAASRFDPTRPACVAWLGVTVYLTVEAIRRTLAWAASLAPGSTIVFEYSVPTGEPSPARTEMAERAAAVGEPWITQIAPADMAAMLADVGFRHVDELVPDAVYERYFRDRSDGLRPRGTARLVRATT